VLYRLLTGASPYLFESDSARTIWAGISSGNITPPSKLAPEIKPDLEMVLMKALRKEPEERYISANALADDLRAYLEQRPVTSCSGDVWYRTRKSLRRHWVSAATSALIVTSLSTALYAANHERVVA
jgi:serine/threonine protein kinase